jgi:hypothetical protein
MLKRCALISLALLLSASSAQSATVIEQSVDTKFKGKTYNSKHQWTIENGRFHLQVSTDNGTSQYIFNGRTFYVCSALSNQQLKFLTSNNINDPDIIKKFKKGACQTVPSNFMARFFLSPSDAVESIDFSDGLKLSLGFSDYSIKPAGKGKAGGESCRNSDRSFTLSKEDSGQGLKVDQSTSGKLCHTVKVDWRKKFWREVSKAVMRQPKGTVFMGNLRKDYAKLKGFVVSAETTLSTKSSGKTITATRRLTTTKITEKKVSKKKFLLPKGYEVFSPENIKLAGMKSDKPTSKKSSEDSQKSVTSVFFCAISSGFGCFNY